MSIAPGSLADWFTLRPNEVARPSSEPPRRTLRASEPPSGTIAGKYRVASVLRQSGLGTLYSAISIETGRPVLVKILDACEGNAVGKRAVDTTARALIATKHEHLVKVTDVGIVNGVPYVATEQLAGETLRDRIREVGPLSPANGVAIALQLLDALAVGHASKLFHANVKPENVVLTSVRRAAPEVKLVELGIAKLFAVASPDGSVDGGMVGTPPYLAMEQLAGMKDIDERVDIWAVGLLLFEMLTGRRAYDGRSYAEVARRIAYGPTPSVGLAGHEALDSVIGIALAKRRDDRFRSAADFKHALAAAWKIRPRTRPVIPSVLDAADEDGEASTELHVHVEVVDLDED